MVQFNSTLSKSYMSVSVEIERSGRQFFPPRTIKNILLQEPENSSDSLYKQGGRGRVRLSTKDSEIQNKRKITMR